MPDKARAPMRGSETIVGSWFGTVTATSPALGQFHDMISFHAGGVVTESRRHLVTATPIGKLLETGGHGAWTRKGPGAFEAFFRFIVQNADTGEPVGTDNVRLSLTLDPSTNTLKGTFASEMRGTDDTLLVEVAGDYSATPITV